MGREVDRPYRGGPTGDRLLESDVTAIGSWGGEPMTLVKDSGWILGKIAAGTPTYIQNAGFAGVSLQVSKRGQDKGDQPEEETN